jgi:hypothetical protein
VSKSYYFTCHYPNSLLLNCDSSTREHPKVRQCRLNLCYAATYAFNMAAYYNTTTTVLNPYIYTAVFPTAYTDTTYHIGLSIQQMQYFIANRIINYTCWVDVKMATGATVLLYTNTANKIAKLSIYLLTISPGFLDYYFM